MFESSRPEFFIIFLWLVPMLGLVPFQSEIHRSHQSSSFGLATEMDRSWARCAVLLPATIPRNSDRTLLVISWRTSKQTGLILAGAVDSRFTV